MKFNRAIAAGPPSSPRVIVISVQTPAAAVKSTSALCPPATLGEEAEHLVGPAAAVDPEPDGVVAEVSICPDGIAGEKPPHPSRVALTAWAPACTGEVAARSMVAFHDQSAQP